MRRPTTGQTVVGQLAAVPFSALIFWLCWNRVTDPDHPLGFGPIFFNVFVGSVPFWVVRVVAWLWK